MGHLVFKKNLLHITAKTNKMTQDDTVTFMHLADTFIPSDLQCIQVIHYRLCSYMSKNSRYEGKNTPV